MIPRPFARHFPRSWLVALLATSSGCPFFSEEPAPSPCDEDRYGCEPGTFELDPSCLLEGELIVALGEGQDAYVPLAEGEAPMRHYGVQGGSHLVLGVRVENPALDRYDTLLVQFGIYPGATCESEGVMAKCSGEPEGGFRSVVIGGDRGFDVADDESIREYGIVLLEDTPPPDPVLQVMVTDPCSRIGFAQVALDDE